MIMTFVFNLLGVLVLAVLAVLLLNWLLRTLDERAGIYWAGARKTIMESQYAPFYFGLRFVGVCYIVGSLFSKYLL